MLRYSTVAYIVEVQYSRFEWQIRRIAHRVVVTASVWVKNQLEDELKICLIADGDFQLIMWKWQAKRFYIRSLFSLRSNCRRREIQVLLIQMLIQDVVEHADYLHVHFFLPPQNVDICPEVCPSRIQGGYKNSVISLHRIQRAEE